MAVDRDLLHRVGVAGATAQPRHIRHPQAELGGAHLEGLLAVGLGDFPEHIGPLGIAGQEDNAGIRQGWQLCGQLGLGDGHAPLATSDRADQLVLRFAAVQGDAQFTRHLAQLAQGQSG